MVRTFVVPATLVALITALFTGMVPGAGPAAADPTAPAATTAYMFGRCYDPSQPIQERPQRIVYGCDSTNVMEDMTWSSWGANGAQGTGTDNAVECQPNCAQGPHLLNPIVVHAWNPLPADQPGCPENVQFYSDFTVAYPKGVPPWVVPGTAWGSDVEYIDVDGMPAVHYFNQQPFSCSPLD